MKKPKNVEELKKVVEERIESERSTPDKKVLANKNMHRAKMMGLVETMINFMRENDMEDMMEEKAKQSTPTAKSTK